MRETYKLLLAKVNKEIIREQVEYRQKLEELTHMFKGDELAEMIEEDNKDYLAAVTPLQDERDRIIKALIDLG